MGNEQYRGNEAEELLEKIFTYMSRVMETKEFSKTIKLLTDLGKTLVNSDRASFWFYDQAKGKYWTIAASGTSKITVPAGTGIIGASIENNECILINNPYEDSRFNSSVDKSTGYVTKSILCIPVTDIEGEVIGAYQAINKLDRDGNDAEFGLEDKRRISLAAAFCGKALDSYLRYNESLMDQLTGLKNRRGFFQTYHRRIIPNLSTVPCSVIMCDIDHFKKINDVYGHNAGDMVLCFVAGMLESMVGIDDEVVRWGGEEFIILLPNYDIDKAANLAEQIRKQIEESVCDYQGERIRVTMSFGVNDIVNTDSPDRNIQTVDQKLYQAKNGGRNRVVV